MTNYSTNPFVNVSQVEMLQYVLDGYLATKCFIEPVKVIAVDEEKQEVDVLPLITYASKADQTVIDSKTIYSIPIFQLQRSNSAIIMMPVVNDIGLILVCDGNITSIKETKKPSVAQSTRRHSRSDAIYLGGLLNAKPTQYIEFKDDSILINAPDKVTTKTKINDIIATEQLNITTSEAIFNVEGYTTVNAQNATITVDELEIYAQKVSIRGDTNIRGNLTVSGDISDGVGKLSDLRNSYNTHTHQVSGVEAGGSTVTTGKPN